MAPKTHNTATKLHTQDKSGFYLYILRKKSHLEHISIRKFSYIPGYIVLQSIYVTRERVILKFEARVQIYMAVLNICCEIQNSDRNVVRFSKISSYGISFWLVLFKNMRNIRFLGVW